MNLTPRPDKDTKREAKVLSTFVRPELAGAIGQRVQVINTEILTTLIAVADDDPPGHASIRPGTGAELEEWAANRGGSPHALTEEVQRAIIGPLRVGT